MSPAGESPALAQLQWVIGFHDWARPRITTAARALSDEALRRPGAIPDGNEDGSLAAAIAHVLGAETVWFRRWQGDAFAPLPGAADYPTMDDVREHWEQLEQRRRAWLDHLTEADIAREVTYRSATRDVVERFPLWQTILHLSNHTSHHRGEVAAALSGLGSPPESVDVIDYMRSLTP
ncbi:MAG TPA: DinB family protein [Actinomycetota bacterium]|nr:DinB family protein [Actinomycetota bacterium]